MKITTLVDNQSVPDFCPEFGLSFLIRHKDGQYLFDTGAGAALKPNMEQCGIAPDEIKKVILSHGHYDHTGGLVFLNPDEIWCCPGIEDGHFSRHETGEMHEITMPEASRNVLSRTTIHWIEHFQAVTEDFFLTGPIPRISGEDCGGSFFHDGLCRVPDHITEEQALLTKGGCLITGCCHAGIINTILFCREQHPEIKIDTVVGGLHLLHANEARLQKTAAFLKEAEIRRMYLLHCTGDEAIAYLRSAMPDCEIRMPVPGETFEV